MLVRGPGIPDERRGVPVAVPALAKGHQRPGIERGRVAVLIGGQQLLERAVIVLSEQASGEDVPYPLIVLRVQLEHVAGGGDSAVDVAKLQERARETGPGPHIKSSFQKAPEVAAIPRESPWPEHQLSRCPTRRRVASQLLDSWTFVSTRDVSS